MKTIDEQLEDALARITQLESDATASASLLTESGHQHERFRQEIAALTAEVNSRTENIGARRLHTLLEKLLEEVSFSAPEIRGQTVVVDKNYVRQRLQDIVADSDLSRFIL